MFDERPSGVSSNLQEFEFEQTTPRMFTDDPYSSRQDDLEMTPVSQTSSMLAMAPNEEQEGNTGDLNESYPLMNALAVK